MKMFLRKYFMCLVFLPLLAQAQMNETFDDGDFLLNPQWLGETDSFLVENGVLRSNGPQAAANIYLAAANALIDSTEWNFWLKLAFNPSSTNYVRVYLASDQQNLSGSLNGYFVQFGAAGSSPDTIVVYRQTGNGITKIFAGVQGCMGSTTSNQVNVRVVRHTGGTWDVYTDCTGGNNLIYEGSFTDNVHTSTQWLGVMCRYATASRYNQYYFDNFSVRYFRPDTIRPTVLSVLNISGNTCDILFSEAVSASSAQQILNYGVNNGIGSPITAVRDAANNALVHLTFANSFVNSSSYLLSVAGVTDVAGNMMLPATWPFSLYTPSAYDILINEIMADPSPVVGLPDVEFVELYNRSAFDISLAGWKFSDASTTIVLPAVVLPADSFIVLCKQDSAPLFQQYGRVLPLSALPSLNNSSDVITLKDANNNVIHTVTYSDAWYQSTAKSNGGWTLELINPNNPCRQSGNWVASEHPTGGTPGRNNSVRNAALEFVMDIEQLTVISDTTLLLLLSEIPDTATVNRLNNYSVSPGSATPYRAVIDSLNPQLVILYFSNSFVPGTIYTLRITGIANCAGNVAGDLLRNFALPQTPAPFDVLIHELMADPDPVVQLPDAEYVELYNRSNKTFNLRDWTFSKPGQTGATLPDYLLLPDSFLILTSATNAALFAGYGRVLGLSSFPALTNSGDVLLLRDKAANLIHYVAYTDAWYVDNGKNTGGWALEMIDPNNPCTGSGNWKAAEDGSGGTPGRANSVWHSNPDTLMPAVLRAYTEGSNTVYVVFNEPVGVLTASDVSAYSVSPLGSTPALAMPMPFDYKTVRLEFLQAFEPGEVYTLTVRNTLTDCSGNTVGISNTARFALPDSALAQDVIINEILFNPRTYGVDFVELYNRSNKVIDVSQLELVELDVSDVGRVLEIGAVSAQSFLLFPGQWLAITENTDNVLQQYTVSNPDMLLSAAIPNFPDDEGICVLRHRSGTVLDSLHYNSNWHYALLDVEDGVSLERTDYDLSTNNKNNWHSAASAVGFATPTYLNSQYAAIGNIAPEVNFEPEVFSPNADGQNDVTFLTYKFDEPGYTINARLFDATGREIKTLLRNETLGTEGRFIWDGTDDNGRKARTGIYFALVEVFNLSGKVKRYKPQVVLGAQLN